MSTTIMVSKETRDKLKAAADHFNKHKPKKAPVITMAGIISIAADSLSQQVTELSSLAAGTYPIWVNEAAYAKYMEKVKEDSVLPVKLIAALEE